MEDTIKELFEQFLINEDCYSQFLNNLLEQYKCSLEEYFKYGPIIPTDCAFPKNLIDGAFWWGDTTEGLWYWDEISLKWKEILKSYLNNS